MCYEKRNSSRLYAASFPNAELPCGVEAIEAYGHTPGHTVYQIGNAFSCTLLFVTKYLYG